MIAGFQIVEPIRHPFHAPKFLLHHKKLIIYFASQSAFKMNQKSSLEELKEIRNLMDRSSRFLSLSGLSGVFAGVYALVAAYITHLYLLHEGIRNTYEYSDPIPKSEEIRITFNLGLIGGATLLLAIGTALLFTARHAKRGGEKLLTRSALRLAINMMLPLVTGAMFCMALLYHNEYGLVAPTTLVFYGMALLNGSKYTHDDIRYLGLSEIGLGLIACFWVGHGLEFWAVGFGLLHILYGFVMWYKYERN